MKRFVALFTVGGLLVGAVGGALWMAWRHPVVDTTPLDHATQALLVTAPVELRQVREAYVVSGTVVAGQTVEVKLRGGAEGSEVVTARARTAGEPVMAGSLLAEVSGRPVLGLPQSVPLYRDLVTDATGSDVEALQRLLTDLGFYSRKISGRFDWATLTATRKLFQAADYDLPKLEEKYYLPLSWTAALPAWSVTVASAAAVGETIDSEHPLVKVNLGQTVVKARVDLIQAKILTVEAPVEVSVVGGEKFQATVAAISDFLPAESGQPAGYDITVLVPAELSLAAGAPVTLRDTAEIEQGLAVPLTAIRRDGSVTYVWVKSTSAGTPSPTLSPAEESPQASPTDMTVNAGGENWRRLEVQLVGQAAGYAILAPESGLDAGMVVVVAGL